MYPCVQFKLQNFKLVMSRTGFVLWVEAFSDLEWLFWVVPKAEVRMRTDFKINGALMRSMTSIKGINWLTQRTNWLVVLPGLNDTRKYHTVCAQCVYFAVTQIPSEVRCCFFLEDVCQPLFLLLANGAWVHIIAQNNKLSSSATKAFGGFFHTASHTTQPRYFFLTLLARSTSRQNL